jgi:plastocyanin
VSAPAAAPSTTAKPAPSEAAPPRPAPRRPAPQLFNARMKGQAFVPGRIEVAAGTTVQWKNLDALIHTVNAVDKSFSSGAIGPDGTYSHTFSKPGTYAIYCIPHPFMKATVVVK